MCNYVLQKRRVFQTYVYKDIFLFWSEQTIIRVCESIFETRSRLKCNLNPTLNFIYHINIFIWLLRSVLTSLSTEQQVLGSIPGSALGLFSSGELFHSIYGLGISLLFAHVLSYDVIGECLWTFDFRSGETLQLCSCFYM